MFTNAEKVLLNDIPFASLFCTDVNRLQHNYVKGAMYSLFEAIYELKEAYTKGRE